MSFVNKTNHQYIQGRVASKEGVRCQAGGAHDYDKDILKSSYGFTQAGANLASELKGSYAPITSGVTRHNQCGGKKKKRKSRKNKKKKKSRKKKRKRTRKGGWPSMEDARNKAKQARAAAAKKGELAREMAARRGAQAAEQAAAMKKMAHDSFGTEKGRAETMEQMTKRVESARKQTGEMWKSAQKVGHEETTLFCQNYLESDNSQAVQKARAERLAKEDAERERVFKEEQEAAKAAEKARWDELTPKQQQRELDKKAAEEREARLERENEAWLRRTGQLGDGMYDGGSKKSRKTKRRRKSRKKKRKSRKNKRKSRRKKTKKRRRKTYRGGNCNYKTRKFDTNTLSKYNKHGGAYSQYGSNEPNSPTYSFEPTTTKPWALGPGNFKRTVNKF